MINHPADLLCIIGIHDWDGHTEPEYPAPVCRRCGKKYGRSGRVVQQNITCGGDVCAGDIYHRGVPTQPVPRPVPISDATVNALMKPLLQRMDRAVSLSLAQEQVRLIEAGQVPKVRVLGGTIEVDRLWREIDRLKGEAEVRGAWKKEGPKLVFYGSPPDDDSHNCDAMGCASIGPHVLEILEAADPANDLLISSLRAQVDNLTTARSADSAAMLESVTELLQIDDPDADPHAEDALGDLYVAVSDMKAARAKASEIPSATEEERDLARMAVKDLTGKVLVTPKDAARYFIAKCTDTACGWRGLSRDCAGGGQIADTGDYSDIRCPACNSDVDDGDEEVPRVNAASLEQLADAVAMNKRLLGERDAFGKEGKRAQAEENRLRAALESLRHEAAERGDMSQFVETVDAILSAQAAAAPTAGNEAQRLAAHKGLGLISKYIVTKSDGRPVDPGAEYFVLRLDNSGGDPVHVAACRSAALHYAERIADHLPLLAADLRAKYAAADGKGA